MSLPVRQQQGATMLLLLLLLGTAAMILLVSSVRKIDPDQIKRRKSAEAMLQARQALQAWSVARGDDASSSSANSPGELPCPDTNSPGSALEGLEAASCSAGAIGRLPWRTLGIPKLLDGYGEPLWYSVDGAFKRRTSGEVRLINSDSRATLQVYAENGVQLLTPSGAEAAAVIFAPGPPLPGQDRNTGVTVAANYLESASSRNNAQAGGPFISAAFSESFNDMVLTLSGEELIDSVTPRLVAAVRQALTAYRASANNPAAVAFPRPARIDNPDCQDNDVGANPPPPASKQSICVSQSSQCRGILPQLDIPPGGSEIMLSYPNWFKQNLWHRAVYYAVGNGADFSDCAGMAIAGQAIPDAILIFLGSPRGNLVRVLPQPQAKNSQASPLLADYLEVVANQDGWTSGAAADSYQLPGNWQTAQRCSQPGAGNNDRLCTLNRSGAP